MSDYANYKVALTSTVAHHKLTHRASTTVPIAGESPNPDKRIHRPVNLQSASDKALSGQQAGFIPHVAETASP
jgi:hypothetical protein